MLLYARGMYSKSPRAVEWRALHGERKGIEGLPEELAPGTRLRLGAEVVLEVVEKRKRLDEPHSYDDRGWCLLPKTGYFLRVLEGGTATGDDVVTIV